MELDKAFIASANKGMNLLSTIHDPNAAYAQGDVPTNDNNEWEFMCMKDVPSDQNIPVTNTEYWVKAFGTEADRLALQKEISDNANKINLDYSPHDLNAAYTQGDYIVSVRCIAIQDVPKDSNIELTNETYWATCIGSNSPPIDVARTGDVKHNPNYSYLEGHCVYEIVDGSPVGPAYRSLMRVPANENILLTNTKYWKAFGTTAPDKNKNYLVGCAAIIVNSKNEFLIGRRVDMDGVEVWALFGGKPESYESLAEGLAREVKEEVNVHVEPYRYLYINMKEAMASKTQRAVTAYFLVKLSDFEVSGVRNLEPEKCFELKWASFEELCEMNLWQYSIDECKAAYTILTR